LFENLTSSVDKKSTLVLEDADANSTWLFNLSGGENPKSLTKAASGFSWGDKAPKDKHTASKTNVANEFTNFTALAAEKKTPFAKIEGTIVTSASGLESALDALSKNENELVVVDVARTF